MLIGNSIPEYIFIRIAIYALRLVAPVSLLYLLLLVAIPSLRHRQHGWWIPLDIWTAAEATFFLFCYLPMKVLLQREASHPTPPGKEGRQLLFQRCLDSITDIQTFLSKWFLDAPMKQIRRENVKELFAFSLLNVKYEDVEKEDTAELEYYADHIEDKLQTKLESGRGQAECLRGTLDAVSMQHRPLLWYMVSRLVVGLVRWRCGG